jgi:hypothetical protein
MSKGLLIAITILAFGAGFLGVLGVTKLSSGQPDAPSLAILAVANAIAIAENSPSDWNNPGDLTISFGYPTLGTANSAGVLKFENLADGWNALYRQLSAIVNGTSRYSLSDSLTDFGAGYSGGDPNWAINVARTLRVDPNVSLGSILT